MKHTADRKALITRRWIYGILSLAMMLIIFFFSEMPAKQSDELSGQVAEVVAETVYPDYEQLPAQQKTGAYRLVHHVLRKSAHFSEYALLGILLYRFFCTFSFRFPSLATLVTAGIYALSDEWHQGFVEGRGPAITDVLIDTSGAAFGIVLSVILLTLFRAYMNKRFAASVICAQGRPKEESQHADE